MTTERYNIIRCRDCLNFWRLNFAKRCPSCGCGVGTYASGCGDLTNTQYVEIVEPAVSERPVTIRCDKCGVQWILAEGTHCPACGHGMGIYLNGPLANDWYRAPEKALSDPANPQHYKSHPSGVECIQITEHMNFNVGNAVKYLWRAGLKGALLDDLRKARWYIDREISRLEKEPKEHK